ncbi:MAG TPA: methyltransferase domain-containing protein, partial [Mycobacteriales bacterium]|nr:methyltransferase domain-containing protein [Mycobacteriales bacterium]
DPELLSGGERFDVVVLADVIEHTTDSSAALQQALRFCADGGAVVVSVPNIAHWSARLNLARGRWDYTESGLMDRGHLRFFTPRTILAEMDAAGVEVETVSPVVPRLRNHVRSLRRLPRPVQARVEQGWQALGRRRPALMAYQLIIVGRVRRG